MAVVNAGDLLSARAASDAVAVHDLTGPRPRDVSYRALAAGCDAVAGGLVARGLAPGARVALIAGNRLEFLESFLGIMKAGCVPLPISIRLPEAQLAALLAEAEADLVLCDGARAALIAARFATPIVSFDDEGAHGFRAMRRPGPFAAIARPADAIAMQPYSSGTTGLPKGILLTQANVAWAYSKLAAAKPPPHVVTVAHPLYHKNAMLGTKGALLTGGRVVMMERFEPERFCEVVGRFGVTKIHTVPTMMAKIMATPGMIGRIDQRTIRDVHMGSAPVSLRLFEEIVRAFPNAYVRISYGVTEAGPMQFGEHPQGKPRPKLSIGCRLPDVELRLVGGAHADEGVLHIRNPGVMAGYHKRPAETAKRFAPDGWFVTGDILRRDADGFYFFVGRDDDMFVVSGHNLYPAAVEETLLRHPDIAQAAVVAIDDAIRGQVPHAFVVARAGAALDERSVQDFARANAPAHEYPRRVHVLAELPVAGTNKIDRARLKALAAERAAR
jgi:acyl-CoA synthetase (AMP-forming)/AMP-acid ligase II